MKNKGRWIWITTFLFVCCGGIQNASTRDMIPPSEPVRKAADEFKQSWRAEAEQKFNAPGLVAANHVISYSLPALLLVLLVAIFHLMVKANHVAQKTKQARAGLLSFYTRMWLVSRWGFRY